MFADDSVTLVWAVVEGAATDDKCYSERPMTTDMSFLFPIEQLLNGVFFSSLFSRSLSLVDSFLFICIWSRSSVIDSIDILLNIFTSIVKFNFIIVFFSLLFM